MGADSCQAPAAPRPPDADGASSHFHASLRPGEEAVQRRFCGRWAAKEAVLKALSNSNVDARRRVARTAHCATRSALRALLAWGFAMRRPRPFAP